MNIFYLLNFLLILLSGSGKNAGAYPRNLDEDTDYASTRIDCPFQNKRGKGSNLPSYEETHKRRIEWENLPEVEEFNHKYTPGIKNDGETYCSSNLEHKFCNKVHGEWGDSIPNDGEYCLNMILEFEDPEDFGYGTDTTNTTTFEEIFYGVLERLAANEDTWLVAGGTAGFPRGDIVSSPWPFASIIWKHGNTHAKRFISEHHRPMAQTRGLGWGWTFHGHYKAVKCADVWPTLEANGIQQSSYIGGPPIIQAEGNIFANLWNAFSDMKSYHEDFYPKDTCHVGPCPGDGTIATAAVIDQGDNSLLSTVKESRVLGFFMVISLILYVAYSVGRKNLREEDTL